MSLLLVILVVKIVLVVMVVRRIDECSESEIECLRRYRMITVDS